jgi:hypothetical protein
MDRKDKGGRPSDWTINNGQDRTPLGHDLYVSVTEFLKTAGLKQSDKGAVRRAIAEIRTKPPFDDYGTEALRDAFYAVSKASAPPTEPRDQYACRLQEFSESPDASYALADRLIAICTVKHPQLGLDYVARMFKKVTRIRRLRKPQSKVEWLKNAADMLDNPVPRYPIRPWDNDSNANIEAIGAALRDRLSGVDEIADRTGIKPRTTQELLAFMANDEVGMAARLKHGRYGPPQEGAGAYVRPGEAILKALEIGPASPKEIQIRTGLTEEQVTAGIHWLWKRAKQIKRPEPNLYSLPGPGITDHVYAYEAFMDALRSGKKCMPEVEEITGKNRPELWTAFRTHLEPDGLVKHAGYRSGHAVRPGFRGRVAVFGLTAKGKRHLSSGKTHPGFPTSGKT